MDNKLDLDAIAEVLYGFGLNRNGLGALYGSDHARLLIAEDNFYGHKPSENPTLLKALNDFIAYNKQENNDFTI